jgi:hypothetical protein
MADLKTSQFGTITAAQAESASTEGYMPYVDPSQTDPDLRNKRMTRSEAKKFFGLDIFTALSGTSWDGGNKTLTLTSNTALTFSSTKRNGILRVKQDGTGSRTLSINSVSVPVASDANTITVITFFYDDIAGTYVFSYDTNILGNVGGGGGGGDTTAPTVVSATAIDATHFTVVFSETVVPTAAGWQVHDTVTSINYSPASVTGSGTTWTFALGSGSMPSGNALQLEYNSATGNTVDTSSNEVVTFTGFSMTNGIGGGFSWVDLLFPTLNQNTTITDSTDNTFEPTGNSEWNGKGCEDLKLASGTDGAIIQQYKVDAKFFVVGVGNAHVIPNLGLTDYSGCLIGAYLSASGAMYKIESGAETTLGASLTVGDWWGIFRASGVWKIRKSSDKTTWTDVATLSGTPSGDLYPIYYVYRLDAASKGYNAQGSGLV